jgi:hypothetical protein
MDIAEIKKVLWTLSIEFVKDNNTMMGRYTYQDLVGDVYMASRRRHIIGDLQLFEANAIDDYTEAVFMFSPNYLNREVDMLFSGMGDIKWKLLLPDAIDRVSYEVSNENWKEIEEEIVEKIAISKVEIIYYKEERDFDLNTLISSISRQ